MIARARPWRSLALVALLVLGAAPSAHAATVLVSPAITAPQGDSVGCRIVNTGTANITVRIQLMQPDGDDYFTDNNIVVRPGQVWTSGVLAFPQIHAYCKFSGAFNRAYVRAAIHVYDIGESRTAITAEAE